MLICAVEDETLSEKAMEEAIRAAAPGAGIQFFDDADAFLAWLRERPAPSRGRLRVRCFGYFDVFHEGRPVIFQRRKTRELLAYLVDRNGAACDAEELATALWEGEGDLTHRKSYLRALTTDLRRTLASIGMEDVLIRRHNQWAVRTDRLDCDYYRMMDGEPAAAEAYHGEYMIQYSWAEPTASKLQFSREQSGADTARKQMW